MQKEIHKCHHPASKLISDPRFKVSIDLNARAEVDTRKPIQYWIG
jgi:hypothetical protein